MKQLFIISFALLVLSGICRAQDSLQNPILKSSTEKNKYFMPQENSKEYFIDKHNKLNTTAWVLLSVGTAVGVTGTILYVNASHSDNWNDLGNELSGVSLIAIGSAMVITSVPIFVRSGYYKRKAMDMSANLRLEPYQSGLAMKQYPAIGLRISL